MAPMARIWGNFFVPNKAKIGKGLEGFRLFSSKLSYEIPSNFSYKLFESSFGCVSQIAVKCPYFEPLRIPNKLKLWFLLFSQNVSTGFYVNSDWKLIGATFRGV